MKRRNPFNRLMQNVIQSARSAAAKGQRYGRPNSLVVDIDAAYLEEVFNKQNGCCPYYKKIGVKRKINMDLVYETFTSLAPSVDRIDSSKGYIKGNIVITFRGINQLKQKNSINSFLEELKFLTFGNANETINTNKTMIKTNGSVEVRGTGNTIEFEKLMNQFSSSFTESFLKVVESQFGMGIQSKVVEEVKPKSVPPKKNYRGASERSSRNTILRNENLKPYNPNKLLKPASIIFGVRKASSLVNRGELFWDELAGSGSMYVNKNGSITDFLVDVKKLPQSLYKNI
jgi:hypothetical protein